MVSVCPQVKGSECAGFRKDTTFVPEYFDDGNYPCTGECTSLCHATNVVLLLLLLFLLICCIWRITLRLTMEGSSFTELVAAHQTAQVKQKLVVQDMATDIFSIRSSGDILTKAVCIRREYPGIPPWYNGRFSVAARFTLLTAPFAWPCYARSYMSKSGLCACRLTQITIANPSHVFLTHPTSNYIWQDWRPVRSQPLNLELFITCLLSLLILNTFVFF